MKLKLTTLILVVVIAIIGVVIYLFPAQTVMLLMVGYGLFILGILMESWKHPKWYVKLYIVICSFWEFFWFFYMLASPFFEITFVLLLEIGATLPLIPLWYLLYKRHKKR